jgi:hypothetical protein
MPPPYVYVNETVKQSVRDVADRRGMKEQELAVRVLGWFTNQHDALQAMILGQIDPDPDMVALILDRMTKERHTSIPVPIIGLTEQNANTISRKHKEKPR